MSGPSEAVATATAAAAADSTTNRDIGADRRAAPRERPICTANAAAVVATGAGTVAASAGTAVAVAELALVSTCLLFFS